MPITVDRIQGSGGHFNQFYGDAALSRPGYSTAPYHLGWTNRYGPPGANERVLPDMYSFAAHPGGVVQDFVKDNSAFSSNFRPTFGPLNNIYKVTISGIQNGTAPGGCLDCDKLNGEYYVNRTSIRVLSDPTLVSTSQNTDSESPTLYSNLSPAFWFSPTAKPNSVDSPCGNRFLGGLRDISAGLNVAGMYNAGEGFIYSGSSAGTLSEKITLSLIPSGNIDYYSPGATGTINLSVHIGGGLKYTAAFIKNFGPFNAVESGFYHNRPYMLEGYHDLTPTEERITFDRFNTTTLVKNTGDNSCITTNATCRVEPYKTQPWDFKQTKYYFEEPYGLQNYNTDFNPFCSGEELTGINSAVATSNGLFAGTYPVWTSSFAHNLPSAFNVMITGVRNIKTNELCMDCDGYFTKPITFKLESHDAFDRSSDHAYRTTTRYEWHGGDFNTSSSLYELPESYLTKYNICEYGCYDYILKRTRAIHNVATDTFGLNNYADAGNLKPGLGYESYCTPKMRFDIVSSGGWSVEKGFTNIGVTAYLYMVNGPAVGPMWTKQICTGTGIGPNNCALIQHRTYGLDVGIVPSYIKMAKGLVDCTSKNTWNDNWVVDTGVAMINGYGVSGSESGQYYNTSVPHLCDFSLAQPRFVPNTDYSYGRDANKFNPCIVCTDKTFPQTLTLSYSSISGSTTNIYTRRDSNCYIQSEVHPFIGESGHFPGDAPLNSNIHDWLAWWWIAEGSIDIGTGHTWFTPGAPNWKHHIIGPNVGSATNQRVDCAAGSWSDSQILDYYENNSTGGGPSKTIKVTVTATVSDFVPIRKYP